MKKPLLSEMTLREKIGQTILPYQYHINRKSEVDPSVLRTKEEKAAHLNCTPFLITSIIHTCLTNGVQFTLRLLQR